jgi:hypothetical protein
MQSAPIWTQLSPKWLDFNDKKETFSKFYPPSYPIFFCCKIHFQSTKKYSTHLDKFTKQSFSLFFEFVLFLTNFLKLVFNSVIIVFDHFWLESSLSKENFFYHLTRCHSLKLCTIYAHIQTDRQTNTTLNVH